MMPGSAPEMQWSADFFLQGQMTDEDREYAARVAELEKTKSAPAGQSLDAIDPIRQCFSQRRRGSRRAGVWCNGRRTGRRRGPTYDGAACSKKTC